LAKILRRETPRGVIRFTFSTLRMINLRSTCQVIPILLTWKRKESCQHGDRILNGLLLQERKMKLGIDDGSPYNSKYRFVQL